MNNMDVFSKREPISGQPTHFRCWGGALRTILIVAYVASGLAACAHIPKYLPPGGFPTEVPEPAVESALPITLKSVDLSQLLTSLPIPDHIQQGGDPHWDFYAWATGQCGSGSHPTP
jgi:hypothetical protein